MKSKKPIPPLYFFALLLLSGALGMYLPVLKLMRYPFSLCGIAPIVIGVVLNLWADSLFKKNQTTVKPYLKPSRSDDCWRISGQPKPDVLGDGADSARRVDLHWLNHSLDFPGDLLPDEQTAIHSIGGTNYGGCLWSTVF
ncbi:MAG: hypothetical protein WAL41_00910, partial [Mycobacterium sp.]